MCLPNRSKWRDSMVITSTHDSPKHVHQQECNRTLSNCSDGCSSNNARETWHYPGQCRPPTGDPFGTFSIYSLRHWGTVAAVCTIYKMPCSYSPTLLWQHLPSLQAVPLGKTRLEDASKHYHLQVPLWGAYQTDLEQYQRCYHCMVQQMWAKKPMPALHLLSWFFFLESWLTQWPDLCSAL